MAFKYIVLRTANREIPFIFPDRFIHAFVAEAVKIMLVEEANIVANGLLSTEALVRLKSEIKVVSAGGITLGAHIHCGGESETLKMKSRGTPDAALISLYPYFHGMMEEE